jgi:Undecaprenyl-phosphate glucose phosphotransferase
MAFDTTVRPAPWLPAISRNRHGQAFWAAAAAGIEMMMITASTYGAYVAYNLQLYGAIPDRGDYVWASVAIGATFVGLCLADNQYDLLGEEWSLHGRSRGLAAVVAAFVLLLAVGFISGNLKGYSRGTFLTALLVASLTQLVTRTILGRVIQEACKRGRWRIAGTMLLTMPGVDRALDLCARLSARHDEIHRHYELGRAADGSPCMERLDAQIVEIRRECRALRVEAILIAFDTDNMELVTRAVSALSELPARIQLVPVGIADLMQRSRIARCGRLSVLELLCGPSSLRDRLLKRCLDVVAAATMSVLLSPLLAMVAILIKLDSKGPVLFRQKRHGFNNEPIEVLKFRTMTTCDDACHKFRQAVRGDSRVTRVGRFLRRTNIDELPQLINVLKGEMSMVGPRPHAVAHNEMFLHQISGMSRRHNVKPGITGWAQVNGLRGETDTVEKMRKRVEYDLYYIVNWSFIFDLKILIATIFSTAAYRNAY